MAPRLQPHQLTAVAQGQPVPAPVRRRNLESEMQRALIKWWSIACLDFHVPECLLFSVPNGGGGGEKRGYWLKLEGCRKGAPDLFLAVFRCTSHHTDGSPDRCAFGLFLELKTPTGILSLDQQLFHEALRFQGYRVEVVRTLEECKSIITDYLTK